jgi:hypothetical protein
MIQEKMFSSWFLEGTAGYHYVFSNPYISSHSFLASVGLSPSPLWVFGLEGYVISSAENNVTKELRSALQAKNGDLKVVHPDGRLEVYADFIPLSGLWNFFSLSVIQSELAIGLEGGVSFADDPKTLPVVGPHAKIKLFPSKHVGMVTELSWLLEKWPQDWENSIGVSLGLIWRL